ncbi:FAD-binding oxidoreductase [Actinospongicola halichondriae]|uniref:FAD-binding oxidoreductase n=1 Tax=Actinospongicola halichondriae TaxID=3236844 RepID=UPI003D551825
MPSSPRALVPQGGNTGLVGGSVPRDGEVVVSTSRMDAITDVDVDAGQLTAGAGVTLAAVQNAAAASGWRYGVDFAARDSATVGGMIATNAGGVRVVRHGSTRRQVLGIEAVTGAGRVISRLGGLVKDNTGYDLGGLFCGSEGTLGIVCRARLALVAPTSNSVTALVGFDDVAAAIGATSRLRRGVPGLEAVEMVLRDGAEMVAAVSGVDPVLDPVPAVQLVVEAVGPPDPVEALSAAIESLPDVRGVAVATDAGRSAALWQVREAHTESIARLGTPLKYDVTLPAPRLADFCVSIGHDVAAASSGSRTWIFGHVADGNVHVNVTGHAPGVADAIGDAVLSAVHAAGGSVSAEHGIGTAKRQWLVANRGSDDVATMSAIAGALDPDSICNPNVLLPSR